MARRECISADAVPPSAVIPGPITPWTREEVERTRQLVNEARWATGQPHRDDFETDRWLATIDQLELERHRLEYEISRLEAKRARLASEVERLAAEETSIAASRAGGDHE